MFTDEEQGILKQSMLEKESEEIHIKDSTISGDKTGYGGS